MRGGHIQPWHQVRLVEAASVTELARRDSEQQLIEWQTSDLTHLQQALLEDQTSREEQAGRRAREKAGQFNRNCGGRTGMIESHFDGSPERHT